MVTHFLAVLSGLVLGYLLIYEFNPEEEPMCTKQMIMEIKEQLDKERKAFENNVSSILEHRKEEMDKVFRLEMNEVVRTQNGKLEKLIADLNNVRDVVRNATANIENVAESIKDTPKVAFNAYTTMAGSYPENTLVIFPNVLLNEGGGYNKYTGTFTAPVSGLYHFTAHVCQPGGKAMVVSILHGSKKLATTTVYENLASSCNSVSAPAQVNEGESIFIKSPYSGSMLNADQYRWPSFSGFLVNE